MSAQDKFDDKTPDFTPIDFSGLDLPDFGNMDMASFGLESVEGVDMADLARQLAGRMGRMAKENGMSYEDLAYGYDPATMGAHPTSEREMETFLFNPVSQGLTEKRLAALCLGAVLSEQNGFYTDSIATGAGEDEVKQILAEDYNITDKTGAARLIHSLIDAGDRVYFEKVKSGETDSDKTEKFAANLTAATDMLVSEGFLITAKSLPGRDITGWDMGRAAFIARLATEAGYLSEAEGWRYINTAYEKASEKCSSWADFADSYAVGRAMEYGDSDMLPGILYMLEELLSDPASPWKKIKF